MNKRIRAFLLAAMMVASLLPMVSMADTHVLSANSNDTFNNALTAAKSMTGEVTIKITGKVEYSVSSPSLTGSYDKINFVGESADAEISIIRNDGGGYIAGSGCAVTFTDLKLSKPEGGYVGDAGFMNCYFTVYGVSSVTYTNCLFPNGACVQRCTATFTDCEFANQATGMYSLWIYDNTDVTVTDGKFTGVRGIKMFSEGGNKTGNLVMKNTEFASSVTQKPAIVLTHGESVTLSGNTYPAKGTFELDSDGSPDGTKITTTDEITCRNDDGDCGVLVGDKIYTTVTAAAAAAQPGDTVTLLHNSNEDIDLADGVYLDKNGYTAENVTGEVPPAPVAPVYGGPVMNWVKCSAADNGVVKSGPLAASEGATITLYPKAAAGYVLDTVEVLDAEGNAVELNGLKFRVPLGGVTVNATFKPAQ